MKKNDAISAANRISLILGGMAAGLAVLLAVSPKPWAVDLGALDPEEIAAYARVGLWWAGAAALVPLLVMAATARWWSLPLATKSPLPALERPGSLPPHFWKWVGSAMVVFAILAAFRLPHSLWDDEAYCVRKMILGTYRVKEDGSVRLKSQGWDQTIWYYQMPANHGLQTILSRFSLDTWRLLFRPGGLQLSEPAIRLPSYLAGILAVAALALLGARLGFAHEGVIAAWLFALHPWHLRLSPEARGYAFVFLLIPVACLLALRALRLGTWPALAAFALAEAVLLYTWPGSLLTVAALNLAAMFVIFRYAESSRTAFLLGTRWIVCGLFAAMALMPLVFPWLPQLSAYLSHPLNYDFGAGWLKNLGALLLSGAQWVEPGGHGPPYLELLSRAEANPVAFSLLALLAAVLALAGAWRLVKAGPVPAAFAAVLLIPGPVLYAMTRLKGGHLHEWYLAFLLPALLLCVAAGLPSWRFLPRWLAGCLLAVLFAGLTWPERQYYLTKSVEPFRESVLLTRPNLDPNHPRNRDIITTSCLMSPAVYDPLVRKAFTREELEKLMREADARGATLYSNNGYIHGVQDRYPEIHALLTNEALFETVAILKGSEPGFDRSVHRYRPGTLRSAP